MDSIETVDHYTGSGTLFGYGTNNPSGESQADLMRRIKIVEYLTKYRGRKQNAISLKHLNGGFLNNSFSLTPEGWTYWKDADLSQGK